MTKRLFLDFDGTLVDSRRRQYELFIELAQRAGLSFDEYWRCKREGVSQREMLRRYCAASDAELAAFKAAWLEAIEQPPRLEADVLLPGASDFLARAAREFQVYLVTGRQHFDQLTAQMTALGIHDAFTGVLNTQQRRTKGDLVKSGLACSRQDVFVGDTGEDILTGKELGVYTVGVLSGASSRERLQEYGADLVVDSVADLDPRTLGAR